MTTTPPPLPPQKASLPAAAWIAISLTVALGLGGAAWMIGKQRNELAAIRRSAQEKAVLNNLRMLAACADQFFLENNTKVVKLDQIVGPGKYATRLQTVDGEDYSTLNLNQDVTTWTLTTASGITVTYRR